MKRRVVLVSVFVLMALACSLPGRLSRVGTPTPAPAVAAPPSPSPVVPEATSPPAASQTPTPAPEASNAPLTGAARPANAPGEWPLSNSGNSVQALLALGGSLWAGTTGGVVRWDTGAGPEAYQRFTAADGLALTSVFDLAADPLRAGQIWAAGAEGISFYDGASWRNIPQAEIGLPDTPLRAIAIEGQGSVWVGGDEYFDYSKDPFYIPKPNETQGGLARFRDGAWERFHVASSGLLSNQINDLAVAPDGSLWIASGQAGTEPTSGGVSHYADATWTHYTIEDGLDGYAFARLAFDSAGTLWAGGRRGISWLAADGSGWQSRELFNVQSLAPAGDGPLWIGTLTGLHQYKDGALTPLNTGEVSINALALTASGELWLGTDISLARLSGETLERRYAADGPLNNRITGLAVAADDSLGLQTDGGVSRLIGDRWEHYLDARAAVEDAHPWKSNQKAVWPVDAEGGIWLREAERWWRYDGAAWQDASPPGGPAYLVTPDPAGGMWAVNNTSLLRYRSAAWETVASLAGLADFIDTSDLLVDSAGQVWLASAIPYLDKGGVARWDGSGWTKYTEADGMAGNASGDLALAPDGQVWAANSVRGLSRFDGQAWHVVVGDPASLGLGADGLNAIYFAGGDTIWARLESHCGFEGTCLAGIARQVAGGAWTAYHAGAGALPTEFVADIAVDGQGRVWLATDVGLVSIPAGS